MKLRLSKSLLLLFLLYFTSNSFASDPPAIDSLAARQRPGTNFVDIYFDVDDDESDNITISKPNITIDGENLQVTAVDSGDYGPIPKGTNKHIRWNAGIDFPDNFSDNVVVKIIAIDGEGNISNSSTDPFVVDTRIDKPPVDNWQTVTDSGSTYNENMLIDNEGRIWLFYLRSPGSNQPIYMKVIDADGYVYKSEQIIATASSQVSNEYQTIRAELNKKTGNVWMAFQGYDGIKHVGEFIIFDDTAGVKKSEIISGTSYAPKLASDSSGVMWITWNTGSSGASDSYANFMRYNSDGTKSDDDPTQYESAGFVLNTDIAIDKENKAWLIYEKSDSSVINIYTNDASFITSKKYSTDPPYFSARKIIYSDWENGGQWILKKNNDPTLNQIFRYDISGTGSIPIGEVDNCSFLLNQDERMEVVRFNSSNNKYQFSEYNPLTKSTITNWTNLFGGADFAGSMNEFIAYNRNFPTLKAYLVKTGTAFTKVKLMNVEPLSITIDISENEFNFGNVGIDTLKKDTLVVQNTGNATLNVTQIQVSDPDYTVDQTPFSLEPDQSKNIIITFQPSDTLSHEATLTIQSNAFNGAQNISLTGKGYQRTWLISINPTTLDFGPIPTEDMVVDSFKITNSGTEQISVHDVVVTGNRFSLADSFNNLSLAAGDSHFIGIRFNPIDDTLYAGSATVLSTANSNTFANSGNFRLSTALFDTFHVTLKGSGFIYTEPRIGIEPASVRFDSIRIGNSERKPFNIFNYGNDTLNIVEIMSDDEQFELDTDSTNFTIAPGDTEQAYIVFTPNTADYSKATISIESNDPENSVMTLTADGSGFTYGDPKIFVNPAQLVFNTIRVGKSQQRSFYIDNRGTDNLYISSISTDSPHYGVSYDTLTYGENLVLEPGEPVIYVNVTFRPLAKGSFNGQVIIQSNDPDSSETHIALFGSARDPYPQQIIVNPDSTLNFGEVTIDDSTVRELVIKNDGELTLMVDSMKIGGTNFIIQDALTTFAIEEQDSVQLAIKFHPTAEQNYRDTLTVFNNDPANPMAKIELIGSGVPIPPQNIVVSPQSLNFGEISKNRYLTKFLWISNSGELTLNVSDIASNREEYSVNTTEFSVPPGERKYVAVTFNPAGNTGTINGILSIESNDPDEGVKEVELTGISRDLNPPAISTNFDAAGINFGDVALNSTSVKYLQILNNGEESLEVNDIIIDDSQLSVQPTNFTIYPGSYQWVQVIFTPTQIGALNKSLTIYSNASNSPEHVVSVIGEGRQLYSPRLHVPTQNYSFGKVIVDQQAVLNFSIKNTGEDTLEIDINPSDTTHFTINTRQLSLLSGESETIIVLFTPDTVKSHTNRLQLLTNDPQNQTKFIFITGEGRDLYDPDLVVTPSDSVNFGLALQGRSTPQILTFENRGEKDLVVSSISVDNPQFIVEPGDTSFILGANNEKSLQMRLMPDAADVVKGTALIKSNDPDIPEFGLKLYGRGRDRAAIIALNPDTLDFNTVLIGDSLEKPVYLKNVGEKTLNVSAVIRSDQDNFWIEADNFLLSAGDSGLVNVKFKPVETKESIENLNVKSNDPFHADAFVYLVSNSRDSLPQQIMTSRKIVDFGGIAIGNQLTDTLYIRNLGEKLLNVTNVNVFSDVFSVKDSAFTIPDKGLYKLPVTFFPIQIKEYTDTLTIENNDTDLQIELTGYGREITPAALSINADTLNFGNVSIDSTALMDFYVQNTGDQSLKILSIDSGDEQFSTSIDTTTISARGTKRIQLQLNPTSPGNISTYLTIKSNAVINGTQSIILKANIFESQSAPKIAVSPVSIDFNTVLKDSVYSKRLWISNVGNDTLVVSTIFVTDSLFSVSDKSVILSPNSIKQIEIRLQTDVDDSTTEINADLIIRSNDALNSEIVVPLQAMIQRYMAPKIVITPDSLDYGESVIRKEKALNLTVNNIGEVRLEIYSIISSDPQFYVSSPGVNIDPHSSIKLPVYFKPTQAGAFKAQLEFVSNDTTVDSLIVVPLEGIGREVIPQNISLSIDQIDFGSTILNRSKSLSFYIRNSGERSLEVTNIMITDTSFTDQFTITTDWISENFMIVAPLDSQKVTITYNPTKPDTIGIDLLVESNDPENRVKIIGLKAQCVIYLGPQIVFEPDSLNFGELVVGGKKQLLLSFKNNSMDSTLVISDIFVADSLLAKNFSIEPASFQITPQDSDSAIVTFVPDSNRFYHTQLIIEHNDVYGDSVVHLIARGLLDQEGENQLTEIDGWKYNGHYPYSDALTNGPDHAWFLKDVYLTERHESVTLFVAFNSEIDIYINGSFVTHATSDSLTRWNINGIDVTPYFKLGRNRVAAYVFNETGFGGFDAVLTAQIDTDTKILIRHGDYYPEEVAIWWYYTQTGYNPFLPALHNSTQWYSYEYGWSSQDSTMFSWDFESGYGNAIYDDSRLNNRIYTTNIAFTTGIFGDGIEFQSSKESNVKMEVNLDAVPKTIQMWIKRTDDIHRDQILINNGYSGYYGYGLFINTNRKLGVFYPNGKIATDFYLKKFQWYFLAAQYFQDSVRVFVDNNLDTTIAITPSTPSSRGYSFIGGNPEFTDEFDSFNGIIDQVKIINRTNSKPIIDQIMTIEIVENPTGTKGDILDLHFDVNPKPYSVTGGDLKYKPLSAVQFQHDAIAAIDSIDSLVKLSIHPEHVTISGLQCRIELQTNYGSIFYPDDFDTNSMMYIPVYTKNEISPVTIDSVYKMISIPYELDDQSITNLFEDDLDSYDPYKWRMFQWNQNDTSYIEFRDEQWENQSGLIRGRSAWIVSNESHVFDADSGWSTKTLDGFRIELKPGWNQIANPFPFPVSWDTVYSSFDKPNIFYWNPDSSDYLINDDVKVIRPWEGYFVNNPFNVNFNLIIPPVVAEMNNSSNHARTLAKIYQHKHENLQMLISATANCGRYTDKHNLMAVADGANSEWDAFDVPEPPKIGKYIQLYIDNQNWKSHAGNYAVDFKNTGKEGYFWHLKAVSNLTNAEDQYQLVINDIVEIPENWNMYLFDRDLDIAINLHHQNNYSFSLNKKTNNLKQLKLVIGTDAFIRENSDQIPLKPFAFKLHQNYPNPFNPTTRISFDLPQRTRVELYIYNVLGQRVRKLLNQILRGGRHELIWDGRSDSGSFVASGLYFVRLSTENNIAIKKMMVIK